MKPMILAIDDEGVVILAIKRQLQEVCDVDVAFNVEEAIEKLKQYKYDMVIVDLVMGGGGGKQVIRYLLNTKYTGKICVQSGYIDEHIRNDIRMLGVTCVLEKPVDYSCVKDCLKVGKCRLKP